MHHGDVSPEIAQGLLALKKRIDAAKIRRPSSTKPSMSRCGISANQAIIFNVFGTATLEGV